jgi:hypothetical protein
VDQNKGELRALFIVVMLCLDGVLNVIYGIGAIGDSSFFAHPTHYLIGTLDSWGWVSLILGGLEFLAAGSLLRAHAFGRYFGMVLAAAVALAALMDVEASPFWSLAVFAISVWIIHGLAMFSDAGKQRPEDYVTVGPTTPTPMGPRQPV